MFDRLVAGEIAEGKGRFIPKIEAMLRDFCEQRSWVLPAHDGQVRDRNGNFYGISQSVDLFSSELAAHLACGIDRLRGRLDPALVSRVKAEMEKRIFAPIRRDLRFFKTQGGTPANKLSFLYHWWIDVASNWNAVCWDNVVCAALGILDDPIDRAYFTDGALKSVDRYLSSFAPDGYCSEGMGYWNYGYGHHMLMGKLLRAVSGGKIDIFTRPIQRKVAEYARSYELRPGISPAFADGNGAPSQFNLEMTREIWPDIAEVEKMVRSGELLDIVRGHAPDLE